MSPQTAGEARRWLDFARGDLLDAETLLRQADRYRNVCFLAQQSAEKALKAILVWEGMDVPFRHDLDLLITLIPTGWELPPRDWSWLTQWATGGRYPSNATEPNADQARQAVEYARTAVTMVASEIGMPGT
jgi:HEPN domain-containing protein